MTRNDINSAAARIVITFHSFLLRLAYEICRFSQIISEGSTVCLNSIGSVPAIKVAKSGKSFNFNALHCPSSLSKVTKAEIGVFNFSNFFSFSSLISVSIFRTFFQSSALISSPLSFSNLISFELSYVKIIVTTCKDSEP